MIIQVKEFLDTRSSSAEKKANEFLATLRADQVVDIKYSTGHFRESLAQRSYILVVYKTEVSKKEKA